jgi:hypothetical protein
MSTQLKKTLRSLSLAGLLCLGLAARAEHTVDAEAQALLTTSLADVQTGTAASMESARKSLKRCIALLPSNPVLAVCHKNLGVVDVRTGNGTEAAENFRAYLPFCKGNECEQVRGLIKKYGG